MTRPQTAPTVPRHSLLWALLLQRCPRCRQGRMFRGLFRMNDPCPVCGLIFQREEGYFLGAMYVSYFLSSLVYVILHALWAVLRDDWFSYTTMLLAMATFLPLIPVVFRYSRVIWIYLDRDACPTEFSAGPYEKMRLQQLGGDRRDPSTD